MSTKASHSNSNNSHIDSSDFFLSLRWGGLPACTEANGLYEGGIRRDVAVVVAVPHSAL